MPGVAVGAALVPGARLPGALVPRAVWGVRGIGIAPRYRLLKTHIYIYIYMHGIPRSISDPDAYCGYKRVSVTRHMLFDDDDQTTYEFI